MSILNRFRGLAASCQDPSDDWFSVTLSSNELSQMPRALDCTTSGSVDITSMNGNTVTILLTPGVPYPVRPVIVDNPSSGSVAGGVVGLL